MDSIPVGGEGQASGGVDVPVDKAAQPSEHSASTTTSTKATVDATGPKVDSLSTTTSTDATDYVTEAKVDSPSKTTSTDVTESKVDSPSTSTFTNATDDAKKPEVTGEGNKFQPRHVKGKDAARSAKPGEAVNGPHAGDGSGTVDHAADAAAPAQ